MAAKSANQQSDVLKELLECPVCLRTPTSTPIYQCKQGHLICRECRPRLTTCPVCRVHLDQMRSLLSEKVIEILPNPCKFKAHGCTQEWMKSELGSHELKCQFRLIKCGNLNCPEMFVYSHLLKHMSRDHIKEDFIQNDDVGDICQKPLDIHEKHFGCEVVFAPLHLVYKGLHFFRQCWRNSSGRWFMWVNFPGSSDEAQDYIYTIKIMSKDKKEVFAYTGKVESIDAPKEDLAVKGTGLLFHDPTARRLLSCKRIAHSAEVHRISQRRDKFYLLCSSSSDED